MIRELNHRMKKYFAPKLMEAKQELAQKDTARASNEIIQIQRQELAVEKDILTRIERLQSSNQISIETFKSIQKDIQHLTESFKVFAVKSYSELQSINKNIKHGLNEVNSSVLLVNNSILKSSNQIIAQLASFQEELIDVLSDPTKRKRKLARAQMEAAYVSKNFREEATREAIELYNKALKDDVGKYDTLAWLELGFAYNFVSELDLAKQAFRNAEKYSEVGDKNISQKVEALINQIEIRIYQKEFVNGYEQVKEILQYEPYNEDMLIQKGILELNLGWKDYAINSFRFALNLKPSLIEKIYFYADKNFITWEFVEEFTQLIKSEERQKLNTFFREITNIKQMFKIVWDEYNSSTLKQLTDRIHRVNQSYKEADAVGIVELKGWNFEIEILKSSLIDEIKKILKDNTKQNKNKLQSKKDEIKRLDSLEESEFQEENREMIYQLNNVKQTYYSKPEYSDYTENFKDLKDAIPVLALIGWSIFLIVSIVNNDKENSILLIIFLFVVTGFIAYWVGKLIGFLLKWIVPIFFYAYHFYINEENTKDNVYKWVNDESKRLDIVLTQNKEKIKERHNYERNRINSDMSKLKNEQNKLLKMKKQIIEIQNKE